MLRIFRHEAVTLHSGVREEDRGAIGMLVRDGKGLFISTMRRRIIWRRLS